MTSDIYGHLLRPLGEDRQVDVLDRLLAPIGTPAAPKEKEGLTNVG